MRSQMKYLVLCATLALTAAPILWAQQTGTQPGTQPGAQPGVQPGAQSHSQHPATQTSQSEQVQLWDSQGKQHPISELLGQKVLVFAICEKMSSGKEMGAANPLTSIASQYDPNQVVFLPLHSMSGMMGQMNADRSEQQNRMSADQSERTGAAIRDVTGAAGATGRISMGGQQEPITFLIIDKDRQVKAHGTVQQDQLKSNQQNSLTQALDRLDVNRRGGQQGQQEQRQPEQQRQPGQSGAPGQGGAPGAGSDR